MKAKVLTVKTSGGSSVCLLELGGLQLKDGDALMVDSRIVDRVAKVYKDKVDVGPEREVARLRNGHYERLDKQVSEAPKKMEHTPMVEEESKDAESLQDKAKDKSMGSRMGRKKSKRKGK